MKWEFKWRIFQKILQCHISWKFILWLFSCSMSANWLSRLNRHSARLWTCLKMKNNGLQWPFDENIFHLIYSWFLASVNWCQYWFEYFPFPPINVLSVVENVLAEHDSELLEFYYGAGVKTDLYAWTLLEMAFSEVCNLKLYSMVIKFLISNDPSPSVWIYSDVYILINWNLIQFNENIFHSFSAAYLNVKSCVLWNLIDWTFKLWNKNWALSYIFLINLI